MMAKFRIDTIGDLARQLTFSPHEARTAQVSAAEQLLHLIDPAKAYPLDFVIFKITGYHPLHTNPSELLTGLALQHDLGLLIENVSQTLQVPADSLAEPVLRIEDVTERFRVTSKTVQRWRRRGLPARRFVFADGKQRVGFLLSSVERFFSVQRDQTDRQATFSPIGDSERAAILRHARRLAEQCGCCIEEICRRTGRRIGCSPQTVLHTIRKYDAQLPRPTVTLSAAEREQLLRAYRRGVSLKTLAASIGCSRAQLYLPLLEERVARLKRKKIKFIDDPLYHGPEAAQAMTAIAAANDTIAATSPQEMRFPRDLPPYLQVLYRTPLLTPQRERALFLKFNYHKYQFVTARRRLDPQFARVRDLQRLESFLADATHVKNDIVQANLRLVVSIARKHLRPGLSLMELISDGNITLMRAVEGFDVHRGHRFSTYATLALMKGFARSVPLMQAGMSCGHQVTGDLRGLQNVPDLRSTGLGESQDMREQIGHLFAGLDQREKTVLNAHYGLEQGRTTAATFDELALEMGLSKHRVRQIERAALGKLRALAKDF